MFEKRRQAKREQELRDHIALQYVTSPLWQVRAQESHWFCPYCGQVGVILPPNQPILERIFHHLTERCEIFAQEGDAGLLPLVELKAIAHRFVVGARISEDRAWQKWDEAGRWYCPFCGEAAATAREKAGPLDPETFGEIAGHIAVCPSSRDGRGTKLSPQEINKRIVQANTIERLAEKIAVKVRRERVWQVRSRDGKWVCPYCVKLVAEVDVSTDERLAAAGRAMAEHLVVQCAGYLGKKRPVGSSGELRTLAFGDTPAPPGEYESELHPLLALRTITEEIRISQEEMAEQREMERGLAHARRLQLGMLPEKPRVPGFEFEILYHPCGHLAGDFYDFLRIDDHRLGIVIGDVSGHGVDAALVMGMVKKVLNMAGRNDPDPARALVQTNAEIYRDLERGRFVTIWYGVFDARDKMLRFARCGHEPCFLYNPSRRPRLTAYRPAGMALGIDPGPRFEKTLAIEELRLVVGDHLLLFTDGLTETKSLEDEEFGMERIKAVLNKYGSGPPGMLVEKLERISRKFRGGGAPTDDLTLVAVRVVE